MKLDTTAPLLVVVGAWNPAIFQPQWVATKVFDHPDGATINIAQLFSPQNGKQIDYYGDIGISVDAGRLEIFSNNQAVESVGSSISTMKKIVSLLRHTPIIGLGLNFQFIEDQPVEKLIDSFKTGDSLDESYEILSKTITTVMKCEGSDSFQLMRQIVGSRVLVAFNFHWNLQSETQVANLNLDAQVKYGICTDLMRAQFDTEVDGVQQHQFGLGA